MKNKLIKCTIILVIVAALGAALWRLNSFEKTEMVSMKGYSYEKAVVTEVVTDNLQPDGQRAGYQLLKVMIKSGSHKGETYEATSSEEIFSEQPVIKAIKSSLHSAYRVITPR